MTVRVPKTNSSIEAVEIREGRIEVKLDHGATLVDDDANSEKGGMPSVDFFIKPLDPNGFDNGNVIVRSDTDSSKQSRFLADAQRWGPVREKLAELEELQEAQRMFNFGHSLAQQVVREFSAQVEMGKVTQSAQGAMDFVKLAYTSPRGEKMACTAYYQKAEGFGKSRRLVSFTIDDSFGKSIGSLRVEVSDPAILNRLRARLEPLLQKK